jgi:hypothetical protein
MILLTHDIESDENRTKALYELMKNDFTDDEFQKASERICKAETLFNKYPTPPMFYKQKATRDDKCFVECQKFLDKVEDYLTLGFVPSDWKQEFIDSLTETEGSVLQTFGGISTLWTDCHRDDMPRSISNILKDLRSVFNDLWTATDKVDYPLLEEKGDPEMIEKTRNMLKNCFKKVEG